MSSIRDVKRRIKTVGNTQQLTAAMRTAAVAKYNKTRARAEKFAAYRNECVKLMAAVGAGEEKTAKKSGGVCYVAVTANRGMCGAYNLALMKELAEILKNETRDYAVVICGKWGAGKYGVFGIRNVVRTVSLGDIPSYKEAEELTGYIREFWTSGQAAEVIFVTQTFKNILTQVPTATRVLPAEGGDSEGESGVNYLFIPGREDIVHELRRQCLIANVYGLLLNAAASAHGAMLVAMRIATDNSAKMLTELKLKLNRMRQAAITTEVIEIASSAAADSEGNNG